MTPAAWRVLVELWRARRLVAQASACGMRLVPALHLTARARVLAALEVLAESLDGGTN